MIIVIDELNTKSIFNKETIDRLALAWVHLNCFEWDNICGEKPDGFDDMTNIQKNDVGSIGENMNKIELLFGNKAGMITSWAWWKYELNKSFSEWIEWYMYNGLIGDAK